MLLMQLPNSNTETKWWERRGLGGKEEIPVTKRGKKSSAKQPSVHFGLL
jgi:hypothetical protein